MIEKFVCIDVEMPNGNGNRISAVGVSVFEQGTLTQQLYSLINPETWFQPYVIDLIGITPEMVKTAPTFPEYWPTLQTVMQDALIVAHGAGNDLKALSGCFQHYQIEHPPEVRYLCTVDACIACFPDRQTYSLDALCEAFDIPLQHHHARSDSEACGRLLLKCLDAGLDAAPLIRTFDLDHGHNKRAALPKKKKRAFHTPTERIRAELKAQFGVDLGDPDCTELTDEQLRLYLQQNRNSEHLFRFLNELPHETETENRLHAIILSSRSNFTLLLRGITAFLPHISSERTVRLLRPKRFQKRQPELGRWLHRWLLDDSPFTVLFGMQTLQRYYLKTAHLPEYLDILCCADLTNPMLQKAAQAVFCAAVVKNPAKAEPFFRAHTAHPLVQAGLQLALTHEALGAQKRERIAALLESAPTETQNDK